MLDDEVFCAALELETKEKQSELLRSLCAGDPDQMERVTRLLDAHREIQCSDQESQLILDRPELVFQAFAGGEELLPSRE
jgi:hypothetical protein